MTEFLTASPWHMFFAFMGFSLGCLTFWALVKS